MSIHVVPSHDLIDHEVSESCPCGPVTEAVKRDDGSVGWVVGHHALDAREVREVVALPASRHWRYGMKHHQS